MPEQPKRGRPRKAKEVVDTNMRVTKATHRRIQVLAELLGVSMSEAIDEVIKKQAPEIDEEIKRREEMKQKVSSKTNGNLN